ncbi:MAG: 2-oxo acid dehydrogenase subunit E2 [Planctomycetales bacterium]|nr:2-oxo acid dehydrogenase subunit E2 [Planctomycetales bacterium]
MSQTVFRMPDLGEGVVQAEIVAWHVSSGEQIAEDQPLLDVMTDKATVTIPSPVKGVVLRTSGQVGEMANVGEELLLLEETPTQAAKATHRELQVAQATTTVGARPVALAARVDPPPMRALASPAVRRRAREKGVDLAQVHGSGRGGRITDADIENHLKSPSSAALRTKRTGSQEIHISGLRRQIAQKMSVSSRHIPHFSYFEQVDITELESLRQFLNERRSPDEPKLTYLPFIMLALAKAFVKHPGINAHYDEDREILTRFSGVHLGIATQTERGLCVPVVRHVESLDLWEAAREMRRLVQAARHNTIERQELIGSTFTVTSLGPLGGIGATPLINYPEVGILGVHNASDQPVVIDKQIVIRRVVNLSSSFDHRVVDGADGAKMIQTLKDMLEHPTLIFM